MTVTIRTDPDLWYHFMLVVALAVAGLAMAIWAAVGGNPWLLLVPVALAALAGLMAMNWAVATPEGLAFGRPWGRRRWSWQEIGAVGIIVTGGTAEEGPERFRPVVEAGQEWLPLPAGFSSRDGAVAFIREIRGFAPHIRLDDEASSHPISAWFTTDPRSASTSHPGDAPE